MARRPDPVAAWLEGLRDLVAGGDEPAAVLAGVEASRPTWPDGDPADLLGRAREAVLGADERRRGGVVFTPPDLARRLVAWATEGWPVSPPWRVLDPAAGGGAVLLAAARHQVDSGADVDAVLAGLHGWDVDPLSAQVASSALRLWERTPRRVVLVADGLTTRWDGPPLDLVVGNPPFLGQLASATARAPAARTHLRERFGDAAGGYVDAAALFLLAALDAVRPGGRVVLVQPESVLGAAHAAAVRDEVVVRAEVVGLWIADAHLFSAAVDTCALVLERGAAEARRPVALAVGAEVAPVGRAAAPEVGAPTWSPLLARARGVPDVGLDPSAGTVGDLATATAGFRQHHYALVPHIVDAPDLRVLAARRREDHDVLPQEGEGGGPERVLAARRREDHDVLPQERGGEGGAGGVDGLVRVATTGMVDPLAIRWGEATARIGGTRWVRPAVDLANVEGDDAAVAAWFQARRRPKVLVAPQTRVVEAAVDTDGAYLPATPLVSVEPRDGAGEGVEIAWLLVAALSAPPVTAWALDRSAGTARSRHALKLSARQVLEVPLPIDRATWVAAAADLRAGRPLTEVGPDLAAAYGLDPDHAVVEWWQARR